MKNKTKNEKKPYYMQTILAKVDKCSDQLNLRWERLLLKRKERKKWHLIEHETFCLNLEIQ